MLLNTFELPLELCDVLRKLGSLSREIALDLLLEVHWFISFENVLLQFRDLSADVIVKDQLLANGLSVLGYLLNHRLQSVVE